MATNTFSNIRHFAVDAVMVGERVQKFQSRSIKGPTKQHGLHQVMSMIDLTTLEGKDSPHKIIQLCRKALHPDAHLAGLPATAAVCVYPSYVALAKKQLLNSAVKVASVATGFPSGQIPLSLKLQEVKQAVEDGADEIDMVISRGKFLAGEYDYVSDEIAAIKEACGKALLKVILETGELGTLEQVKRASWLAMDAGADFIKTSTGKIQPAATLPVTYVMLQCISDYFDRTGRRVGMKPAGGISSAKLALTYLVMLHEVLGEHWMSNQYFRFGASSLLNDVLLQLHKMESGAYSSSNYLAID